MAWSWVLMTHVKSIHFGIFHFIIAVSVILFWWLWFCWIVIRGTGLMVPDGVRICVLIWYMYLILVRYEEGFSVPDCFPLRLGKTLPVSWYVICMLVSVNFDLFALEEMKLTLCCHCKFGFLMQGEKSVSIVMVWSWGGNI